MVWGGLSHRSLLDILEILHNLCCSAAAAARGEVLAEGFPGRVHRCNVVHAPGLVPGGVPRQRCVPALGQQVVVVQNSRRSLPLPGAAVIAQRVSLGTRPRRRGAEVVADVAGIRVALHQGAEAGNGDISHATAIEQQPVWECIVGCWGASAPHA